MKKLLLSILLIQLSFLTGFAQYDLPFGFEKQYNVSVLDIPGNPLPNAWAGGLNACQFGEVDLDGDGIRDLVVFDRNGNRTLTYLNHGTPGQIAYEFAPELAGLLPHFDDWVIFADYNMDGRNDIFTYSKGYAGIKVYKNTGHAENMFELVVDPYLKSFQGNGYVNILVTYADYPAINDIDNDGDLDILTFWGLGSFVEFHLNESMELYGHADSLIFRKTENCWGRFAESEESNIIYLDTCFDRNLSLQIGDQAKSDPKHTGSTFMLFDENGDGLPDLLLGDVDYSTPVLLVNGGTHKEALMVSHTFQYPENNDSINLLSFPVMSYLDVNNDGYKDMIVSPFDPSLVKAQNLNSTWLYENKGPGGETLFERINTSFLQDEMLDFGAGAVPVFFDHNQDELMDIVVGNFGYLDSSYYGTGLNLYCTYRTQLALLQNVGTASEPAFQLIDDNYTNLPSYFASAEKPFAAIPAFGDLDGDGDEDMLVGNAEGTLFFFENTALSGQAANFELTDFNYQQINAGSYCAPQLFDLDGDNLKDLIIGNRNGTISFYKNTGSASSPEFSFITDSLGGVDVRDPNLSIFGYCIPHFFKNTDGEILLFAGSEFGNIYYYEHIQNNLEGTFELVMKNYLWIDEGLRSAVAIANMDNDNYPDMLVGNYSGGLSYFKGTPPPPAGNSETIPMDLGINIFPNPARDYVNITYPEEMDFEVSRILLLDFTGKEIWFKFESWERMYVGDLPDGIYLLNVQLQSPSLSRQAGFKILIQH